MSFSTEFAEITTCDQSLAPHTWLKVGGPAQYFVQPRSADELQKVVVACHAADLPVRILGSGANVLVADSGVPGVVMQLSHPEFLKITITGNRVVAGAGVSLSHLISQTVEAGLAGLETLVGIPGTVGGALKGNAGGRSGEIADHVVAVTVLNVKGEKSVRWEDELIFAYRFSSINELAVLEAEFELTPEDSEQIAHRMKKLWVLKKASQPLSFQSAGCVFKNPRGLSAGALIEQAGLKGSRVGKCEVSDRHANFIVTEDGATATEVRELIEKVRARVDEKHGVELELEIQVWP